MNTLAELEALSRKELQNLAKEHGLKANKKSSVLIDELAEILFSNSLNEAGVKATASDSNTSEKETVTVVTSAQVEEEQPVFIDTGLSDISPIDTSNSLSKKSISKSPFKSPFASIMLQSSPLPSATKDDTFVDEQEIDVSVISHKKKSFRNLTMDISQNGRTSISSPVNNVVPAEPVASENPKSKDVLLKKSQIKSDNIKANQNVKLEQLCPLL